MKCGLTVTRHKDLRNAKSSNADFEQRTLDTANPCSTPELFELLDGRSALGRYLTLRTIYDSDREVGKV